MRIIHHGGHQGVTGSCHQLKLDNGKSFLVDCGLFQGDDARRHPDLEIEFPLAGIDSLILTHVHIDHVGRLPYLFAAGFRGSIYCTKPTAKMLPLTLEDALKIGFTQNRRLINQFLNLVNDHLRPTEFQTWKDIECGARIKFKPAGHILGSAYVEVLAEGQKIIFSGDLGAPYAPLLKSPKAPYSADTLILESTYGDKNHQGRRERRQTLQKILEKSLDDKGTTIIPAFSLGRTQELLYEINAILQQIETRRKFSLLKEVDVIVDSPLGGRFTEIYKSQNKYWDAEARQRLNTGDQPLIFENLTTVDDHQEHKRTLDYLDRSGRPAIVIAGSGMCTGGRVVNYLKRLLDDSRTDVVFVGYQGRGTPGRDIQARRKSVEIDGRRYSIKAGVHTLSGYSAHADQSNLVNFVKRMRKRPKKVILVHGERHAKTALKRELEGLGLNVK